MNLKEALSELVLAKYLSQFYHRWSVAQAKGLPVPDMLRSFGENAAPPVKKRVSIILTNMKQGRVFHYNESGCFTDLEVAFLDVGFSTATDAPTSFSQCDDPVASGTNPDVRFICFNPKGAFLAAATPPSFSFTFRARIR